ncbi:molecular chaperone [Thalassotalea sediminis]|uniref:molecular chaperone n=1 Tax=Thalassotalea sediminis TaxID=1759089 RepID=UPI00257226D7|nr:molecular chaperone [Thalassotalea sediminis]
MIGFDYGTSNCAVGVMENNCPKMVNLPAHGNLMPSTLYAPDRDIIVSWLFSQLSSAEQELFKKRRMQPLQKGQAVLRELSLDGISSELSFGDNALANYLAEPDEGYYIKSPKSFLGASGLKQPQVDLFEDIVAAMMAHVKQQTEASLKQNIHQAVIGRPINFQGLKGEESNQQAIDILTNAAKRVGFSDVEFQFEPVAAGFEYEASLHAEKRVLVVDIGGGTTDCSMILMGPQYVDSVDRSAQLLAHAGERVGGNDFDIQLAFRGLMPNLGATSQLKTGKPMPTNSYWQAVAINNINEQTAFYSAANGRFLQSLQRDAEQPELVSRLYKLYRERLSYQLVNSAERAKISLSNSDKHSVDLTFLDQTLMQSVDRALFQQACNKELQVISRLMRDTMVQANCSPDVIFVTGGTAKSPVISEFIKQQFTDAELVIGDHFGSVTAGLTRWASKIFR